MNQDIFLRQLSVSDGYDIFQMLQRIGKTEHAFSNPVNGMTFDEYRAWLQQQDDWARGKGLPDGYVAQTIFWFMDGAVAVGIGKIRHALTERSREFGGNIGYAIDPLYRGKGYGSQFFAKLLLQAERMGICDRLVTVEKYNFASKKIVEKNGGDLLGENASRWFFTFPTNGKITKKEISGES